MGDELQIPTALASPVSTEQPCGAPFSPEVDQKFLDLEQTLNPKNPKYGEVSWAQVFGDCCELLLGRRDLKLGLLLTLAALKCRGLKGFADGLHLLTAWVKSDLIWNDLPPSNLAGRINLFRELSAGYATEGDLLFVKFLYHLPLSSVEPLATLRSFEDGNKDAVIRSIAGSDSSFRRGVLADLAACRSACKELCEALIVRVPGQDAKNNGRVVGIQFALVGTNPGLPLPKEGEPLPPHGLLNQLERLMRGEKVEPERDTGSKGTEGGPDAGNNRSAAPAIGSQAEAVCRLEAIARYYAHHERSSPVPLLVRQARSLVDRELRDIIEQLFGADEVSKVAALAAAEPSGAKARDAQATGAPTVDAVSARPEPGPGLENPGQVRAALEELVEFFARTEPSSPIAIILGRARDLVDARFDVVIGEFLGKEALARFNAMLGKASGPPK